MMHVELLRGQTLKCNLFSLFELEVWLARFWVLEEVSGPGDMLRYTTHHLQHKIC